MLPRKAGDILIVIPEHIYGHSNVPVLTRLMSKYVSDYFKYDIATQNSSFS